MSHIDEGELTAYADGAYAPDSADAQRMRAHLATCANCRNRLDDAQRLSARAGELLEYVGPAAVMAPEFDELVKRAGARPRRRALLPLSWAATLILALGLGWLSRGLMTPPQNEPAAAPLTSIARVQPPAPSSVQPAAPAADQAETGQAESAAPARADASPERLRAPTSEAPPAAAPQIAQADFSGAGHEAGPEYLTLAEAERRGIELHVIPEFEVLRIALRPDTVVIEQKLPDARLITITQTRSVQALEAVPLVEARKAMQAPQPTAANEQRARAVPGETRELAGITTSGAVVRREAALQTVSVFRGATHVVIVGPVPLDSLRAFATQIR